MTAPDAADADAVPTVATTRRETFAAVGFGWSLTLDERYALRDACEEGGASVEGCQRLLEQRLLVGPDDDGVAQSAPFGRRVHAWLRQDPEARALASMGYRLAPSLGPRKWAKPLGYSIYVFTRGVRQWQQIYRRADTGQASVYSSKTWTPGEMPLADFLAECETWHSHQIVGDRLGRFIWAFEDTLTLAELVLDAHRSAIVDGPDQER